MLEGLLKHGISSHNHADVFMNVIHLSGWMWQSCCSG